MLDEYLDWQSLLKKILMSRLLLLGSYTPVSLPVHSHSHAGVWGFFLSAKFATSLLASLTGGYVSCLVSCFFSSSTYRSSCQAIMPQAWLTLDINTQDKTSICLFLVVRHIGNDTAHVRIFVAMKKKKIESPVAHLHSHLICQCSQDTMFLGDKIDVAVYSFYRTWIWRVKSFLKTLLNRFNQKSYLRGRIIYCWKPWAWKYKSIQIQVKLGISMLETSLVAEWYS